MEKSDLESMIPGCPLRITMTSGETFDVEKPEFILVAEYTVAILCDRDGVKRNVLLALMNIANVESLAESST
jgi:hypothetical protein